MKKTFVLNVILILVAASLLAACGGSQPATTPTVSPASFTNDVVPILQSNCVRCHGEAITSYDTLAGSGLFVPGDSQNSTIIRVLQAGIMPRGGQRLSDADIQTIANWIDAGATNN